MPKSVWAPRASTRTPPCPERIKLVVRAVSELPKVRRAVGTCAWRKGASLHSTEFDGSIPKMRLPDKADKGSTRCDDSFVSFGGKVLSSSGENALRLNTTTRPPTKIDSKTKPLSDADFEDGLGAESFSQSWLSLLGGPARIASALPETSASRTAFGGNISVDRWTSGLAAA